MLFGGNIDIFMFWKWWFLVICCKLNHFYDFSSVNQNKIQHYNSVTRVKKCAGEKSDLKEKDLNLTMLERMSSLRCVLNRSCLSQVRNISALAVKVDVPALGPVMTGDKLEQKSQEKVHNYIDLQSSLHQLYKIDLVSRYRVDVKYNILIYSFSAVLKGAKFDQYFHFIFGQQKWVQIPLMRNSNQMWLGQTVSDSGFNYWEKDRVRLTL